MSDKNNKIDQFLDLNNKLSQEVQSSLPEIIKSLGKTKFKYTSKSPLIFCPQKWLFEQCNFRIIWK